MLILNDERSTWISKTTKLMLRIQITNIYMWTLNNMMKRKKCERSWESETDLVGGVEFIVHEASNDAGFAYGLVTQEYQLVFGKRGHSCHFFLSFFLIESLFRVCGVCRLGLLDLNLRKFSLSSENMDERERERKWKGDKKQWMFLSWMYL